MTINEFTKKIDEALAKRNSEIAKLEKEIPEARADVNTATDSMTAAIASANLEAYSTAKAARATASDRVELCEARRKLLKNEPFITEAEYIEVIDAVCAAQTERVIKAEKEILKHLDAIFDICEKSGNEIHKLDTELHRWQSDIYRDADRRSGKNNEGKWSLSPHKIKRFGKYTAINFAAKLKEDGYIAAMRTEVQEADNAD